MYISTWNQFLHPYFTNCFKHRTNTKYEEHSEFPPLDSLRVPCQPNGLYSSLQEEFSIGSFPRGVKWLIGKISDPQTGDTFQKQRSKRDSHSIEENTKTET